jgi:hypothetical protein
MEYQVLADKDNAGCKVKGFFVGWFGLSGWLVVSAVLVARRRRTKRRAKSEGN